MTFGVLLSVVLECGDYFGGVSWRAQVIMLNIKLLVSILRTTFTVC